MLEVCCICAQRQQPDLPPVYTETTEKEIAAQRYTCCGRYACPSCIRDNSRFRIYCPYCQKSTLSTDEEPKSSKISNPLLSSINLEDSKEKSSLDSGGQHGQHNPDVLHFVNASEETIDSLAIRYGIPAFSLRRKNGIFSDHLLVARKTIWIPGEFYNGPSLSPTPILGEEEEARKSKLRKFQVVCKVPEYDIALLYLEQNDYDLDEAIHAYQDDEAWEKRNPLAKGKSLKTSRLR